MMRQRPDMDFQTGDDSDEYRPDHFARGLGRVVLVAFIIGAIPIVADVIEVIRRLAE